MTTHRAEVLADLIDRYCEAWQEMEAERRRDRLSAVCAGDMSYTDPRVHAQGLDELLAHIEKTVGRRPGAKVVRTSDVDVHHGMARFAWQVVEADGTRLPEGLDIAWFSPDGPKLTRIVGFFGPLAPSR